MPLPLEVLLKVPLNVWKFYDPFDLQPECLDYMLKSYYVNALLALPKQCSINANMNKKFIL